MMYAVPGILEGLIVSRHVRATNPLGGLPIAYLRNLMMPES